MGTTYDCTKCYLPIKTGAKETEDGLLYHARCLPTIDKPVCQLSGTDGNVFSVIGNVARTLRRAGLRDEAKTFTDTATKCGSYDEVLILCFEYVEVE